MKDRHLFDNHSILFVLSLSLGIMLLVSIGPTGINEGQGKDFLGNEPSRAGIFDGLDIDYIWTTSFMGVYNFNITYAHVSGSDYSETIVIEGTGSALSNVNNDTRVISSTSGLYSEGSHNPHFINTPILGEARIHRKGGPSERMQGPRSQGWPS